ncbi:hypothetical protein Cgig2_008857 [Carnegiea gigantea]|uniref:EGF-like domain-containing protein n=1 Tax=Carnegiea gigantea TaxID=171969 RepID=A0A9Q1JMT1_9CARY|nr:hypothetical protein Cgig2_008857 [Carnegiea gigantea]
MNYMQVIFAKQWGVAKANARFLRIIISISRIMNANAILVGSSCFPPIPTLLISSSSPASSLTVSTLDFACSEAAPPAQSKETTANASISEPCHWANCGGGICNKTSGLAYTCECKEGYYNLFNNTAFPCFKECETSKRSIGGDCSNLGITMTNKSTAPLPNLPDKSGNQACSLQHEVLYVMIMLVTASAAVL